MPYRLAIAHHLTKPVSGQARVNGRYTNRHEAEPTDYGWIEGLEPSASRATIWRASQLRHTHHILELKAPAHTQLLKACCVQERFEMIR